MPRYQNPMRLPSLGFPDDSEYPTSLAQMMQANANQDDEVTPEDESTLGKIAGGVEWLGQVLDKPGAAVRGLLGGQGVNALANLIPFSDTLGLTNAPEGSTSVFGTEPLTNKRVTGEDLTGLHPEETDDWIPWLGKQAVNLGTEIVTDPLSMVGGPLAGAMSKAGETAGKVAVHTPTTLSAALRTGELPVVSLHAPFWAKWLGASDKPFASLSKNSGPFGEAIAKAAAYANDAVAYSPFSPVRYGRGLLSPAATGELSPSGSQYVIGWGEADKAKQMLNDLAYSTRKSMLGDHEEMMVGLMQQKRELADQFDALVKHHAKSGDRVGQQKFEEYLRSVVTDPNGIAEPDQMRAAIQDMVANSGDTTPELIDQSTKLAEQMYGVLTKTREAMNAAKQRVNDLGLPVATLDDIHSAYWPRKAQDAVNQAQLDRVINRHAGLPDDMPRPDIARRTDLRNVPGGETMMNRAAKNPDIAGFDENFMPSAKVEKFDVRAARLQEELAPEIDKAWPAERRGPVPLDKHGVPENLEDQIAAGRVIQHGPFTKGGKVEYVTYESEVKKWLGTEKNPIGEGTKNLLEEIDAMSPETARKAILAKMSGASKESRAAMQLELDKIGNGIWEHGIYGKHVLDDATGNLKWMTEAESTMRSAHNFLAQPGMVDATGKHTDWASLKSVWEGTKYHGTSLDAKGLEKFVRNNAKDLGALDVVKAGGKDLAKFIDNLRVAPGAEGALSAYTQVATPRVQNELTGFIDRTNTIYKNLLYNVWSASHLRDMGSDLWQATSHGKAPIVNWKKDDGGILGGIKQMLGYISDGKITPEIQEIMDSGMFKSFTAMDIAADNTQVVDRMSRMPAGGQKLWGNLKVSKADRNWKFWNLAGMPNMSPEQMAAGKKGFVLSEFFNNVQNVKSFTMQGGYFAALRKQGYTVAQAKHLVERAFFTGSESSKFARDIASRAIPFWRFSAHNIPYQFAKLFEEPGGITAQTIRMTNSTAAQSDPDVYTPAFLKESQPIAIGANDPAQQAFYTNSVLPLNDLNDIVFKNGLPSMRSLEKPLARIQPLALSPLELFADKQVRTGRKISDLQSDTEGITGAKIPMLDRIIHYSPLSRTAAELRQAIDPRKTLGQTAANLLGYGNVSNYDTEMMRLRDIRNAYGSDLEKDPNVKQYTDYFVPQTIEDKMAPEDVAAYDAKMKSRRRLTKAMKKMKTSKDRALKTQ